jgi:hypothetical protein
MGYPRQLFTMPSHLELDFSRMRRAAFGRRQIEMRWQIALDISGDCYEARGNRGRRIWRKNSSKDKWLFLMIY